MTDEYRPPPRNALRKYPALVLLILAGAAALLFGSENDISLTSPATPQRSAPVQPRSEPVMSPAP